MYSIYSNLYTQSGGVHYYYYLTDQFLVVIERLYVPFTSGPVSTSHRILKILQCCNNYAVI